MSTFNPYRVLQVSHDADDQAIKKAYHTLAMKWHPDKNSNPSSKEMFQNITRAYDILKDPEQRKKYDLSTPIPHRPSARTSSTFNDRKVSSFLPRSRSRSAQSSSFDYLYNQFYGDDEATNNDNDEINIDDNSNNNSSSNNYPFSEPRTHASSEKYSNLHKYNTSSINSSFSMDSRQQMNPEALDSDLVGDININVEYTLEEIYNLTPKKYSVTRSVDGRIEKKTVSFTPTPGIADGTKITLAGKGNRESPSDAHDMVFTFKELKHNRFIRQGDDIIENISITLRDAICEDYEVKSTAIDGEPISLKISTVIQPGEKFKIQGRGMQRANSKEERGDHIFKFQVNIPLLTIDQRNKILEIL